MPALLNRIILLAAFSTFFMPNAKAQSLSWAQAINGINDANGTGVQAGATDTAGNIYSVGYFGGTVDFDRGTGVSNLTAVSNIEMFIMKEDPSGDLIWVKQVKGLSSGVYGCYGRSINVDQNGNVFITGTVIDSFDFDPGPAVYKLNSFGAFHTFVLKLNTSGDFVWVRDIGTQISSVGAQVSAASRDKNGYLYFASLMTGDGSTPIDVDPGTGTYFITPGLGDILLEKLDSNGNFVWAKLVVGTAVKQTWALAFDSASNFFISGKLLGSADFDPGPGVYTLTATPATPPLSSAYDIFVAKYDSAGNFGWAHSFGDGADDEVSAGAVDRFGNFIVTGSFGDTVDFDPGPNTFNLNANSTRSLFTLRLRNNGEFSWVRKAGPSGGSFYGRGLATDGAGNIYTAAVLNGSCDLDPGVGVYNVSSGSIVQELDSAGSFVWGAGWEGGGPNWIGLDNKDSIYVCGVFSGFNKDFDPSQHVFLLSATSGGTYSGYISKLIQTPLSTTGIEHSSLQMAVNVYPNPSSGIITFSSPSPITRIEITDMAGKIIYLAEPAGTKKVIDLSGEAAGIYFYDVSGGGGKQKGKLVIY